MGVGGRTAGQEVRSPAASVRRSSVCQRRTNLRAGCGVVFFLSLVACAPSTSSTSPPPILTIGFPEANVNQAAGLGAGSLIVNSTLEGLTQVNAAIDGRALPRLAESWAWEAGGLRLRLRLVPGVVFHDGTPLSPAVAAEALNQAVAQPGNRALYPSLADIASVKGDGERDLIVELSRRSAFLLEELDLPLSIGTGIGTGPFRLVRRDAAGTILERFDRYYRGAPQIEQIVIRPFDTLRTAWTSLLRGDVDMVNDVPPEAVDFVYTEAIQVVWYARWYQFLIAFNSQRAPFTSPAVRRALNIAVDRQAVIDGVLQGQAQASTGPFWPRHWAYDASVPPYRFDPEFAATLLDEAGFLPGTAPGSSSQAPARLRFTCLLPANFSVLERIGLEVQKQLFDLGVDMQFEAVSLLEYDTRIREGRFEALLVDMISGPTLGRPLLFWGSPRRDGLHAFGYSNPQATRLFEMLRESTNEAAIRSNMSRLQRVMLEDPPAVFLAWNQRARAVSRRFRVVAEPGRDPLLTIWQWTENDVRPTLSTQ